MIPPYEQLVLFDEPSKTHGWRKMTLEGGRVVWIPDSKMQQVQSEVLTIINALNVNLEYAYGGVKWRSIADNARQHAGGRYFFQLDFENAYGQVEMERMAAILKQEDEWGTLDSYDETLELLSRGCASPEGSGLVQGGAASPALFNVYCLPLDRELGEYCESEGIAYSRFLDDLTFSSPDSGFRTGDMIGKDKRRIIRGIIAQHNMIINEKKTRVKDIYDAPVIVTGVQINKGGRLQLTTRFMRQARRKLEQMFMECSDIDEVVHYASGINGLLHSVRDTQRQMSREEEALYIAVQDIIAGYGKGFTI